MTYNINSNLAPIISPTTEPNASSSVSPTPLTSPNSTDNNNNTTTKNIIFTQYVPARKPPNVFSTHKKPRRTTSLYCSDGRHKPTAATAITNREDIIRLKNYFLYNSTSEGKKHMRKRNHLLFILGISTALRVSDLINLDIGQVLERTKVIDPQTNVPSFKYTIKDHIELIDTKTRKSNLVKINDEVKKALNLYFNEYITTCNEKHIPVVPSHPLFQSEDSWNSMVDTGESIRLGYDGVYAILRTAEKKLNLPYHLSTHCLRKTFAYWTLELHPNDANAIAVLQKALNHSSLEATNHYTGRTQEQKDRVFNDIGNLLCDNETHENVKNNDTETNTENTELKDNDNILNTIEKELNANPIATEFIERITNEDSEPSNDIELKVKTVIEDSKIDKLNALATELTTLANGLTAEEIVSLIEIANKRQKENR